MNNVVGGSTFVEKKLELMICSVLCPTCIKGSISQFTCKIFANITGLFFHCIVPNICTVYGMTEEGNEDLI